MTNIVTDFSHFRRVSLASGETRYYPAGSNYSLLCDLDVNNDPVTVNGHGVYDTDQTHEYAVLLFTNRKEADDYVDAQNKEAARKYAKDSEKKPELKKSKSTRK